MVIALSVSTFFFLNLLTLPAGILDRIPNTHSIPPHQESVVIPVVQIRAICQSRLYSLHYPGLNFSSIESCRALSLVAILLKCSQKEQ